MNLKGGSTTNIRGDGPDFHAHRVNVDNGAKLNLKLINLASDVDMIKNRGGSHVDFAGGGKGLNHVGAIDAQAGSLTTFHNLQNLASDVDMINNGYGAHVDFAGAGKGLNHVGAIDARAGSLTTFHL